jgi:S-adenosylmethionine decarboxylase
MFANSLSSGKHLVCDIKSIKNVSILNNVDNLKEIMREICKKYNFEILKEMDYVFNPQGCTIIFLLSESHISIHTFPERHHISFDIYTCRQYSNNNVYEEIFTYLITTLNACYESNYQIINRNF